MLSNLCPEVEDTAQEPMVERAKAAGDRAGWGFAQQEEDPASVYTQNAHVRVPLPEPIKWSQPKRYWGPSCSRRRSIEPSTPGSSDHKSIPFHPS